MASPNSGGGGLEVVVRSFSQSSLEGTRELAQVTDIANEIHRRLNTTSALGGLEAANLPAASSAAIQRVVSEHILDLGFVDESRGLFRDYETSALRPDYYLSLGETGILLEVERGKTTINNMDLLDFWKCHLCPHAHYLFLMVPRALRQNATMTPRNEFQAVAKRLGSFFRPRNYTNVRGLFLFGYVRVLIAVAKSQTFSRSIAGYHQGVIVFRQHR